MKLVICIANKRYASTISQHLNKHDFRVTRLASRGGWLREGNETLLIGVANNDVQALKDELKVACRLVEESGQRKRNEQYRYVLFVVGAQNYLPIQQTLG